MNANAPGGMTCDEFKELAAAYALVALDEQERSACEHHLAMRAAHQGCREAVAAAELVAARLGAALIPERLREERGMPPLPGDAARRRSLYHLCGWLVAAALVGIYLYNAPLDRRALQTAIGRRGQVASSGH